MARYKVTATATLVIEIDAESDILALQAIKGAFAPELANDALGNVSFLLPDSLDDAILRTTTIDPADQIEAELV